jgi:glucan biosynthesis protein
MLIHLETLATRFKRSLGLVFALTLFQVSAATANTQFNIDTVAGIAKKLAAEPFKPPQPLPDYLKQISYDNYRDIRFDPEQSLWKDTGSNFHVQFIHPGLYYTHSVVINTLEAQGVRKVWQINPASQPPLAEAQQRSTPLGAKASHETEPDDQTAREADLSPEAEGRWQTP